MTATVEEGGAVGAPAARTAPGRTPWRRADLVVGLGLTLLTLATRLPRLDRPRAFVFDEVYYALDAADLLRQGVEPAPAHPPLGKWLIAGGIDLVGFTPTGWRLASLLAGVALVLVTWLAARAVTRDPWLAGLGGLLVALDGIAYVTGRLALLDVFVALFVTIAGWAALAAVADRADPVRLRRWRWLAAVALGAGLAVKWGAVWTWPVVAAVIVVLERRAAAPGGPRRRRTLASLATLALVPLAVYVLAFGPWLANAEQTAAGLEHCGTERPCRLGVVERGVVWVEHQRDLVEFHAGLEVDNVEAAPAWTWALQTEPSDLFRKPCLPAMADAPAALDDGTCTADDGPTRARVLALANPVGWLAGLLALGALAVIAVRRRDDTAGLLLALAASQWVPWMLGGRDVYSYYAVSLVPFLALAVVAALEHLPRRAGRRTALALAVLTGAAFWFVLPLLGGVALGPDAADLRLLLPGWA